MGRNSVRYRLLFAFLSLFNGFELGFDGTKIGGSEIVFTERLLNDYVLLKVP